MRGWPTDIYGRLIIILTIRKCYRPNVGIIAIRNTLIMSPDGVAEAPDWYEYKYQASEGTPFYYIQEIYALENGKKYLLKRKYFEKDSDEPIYFMDDKCDSVKRSIVTVGTQKRLDIRNYSGGRLRRFESYPYSEKGVPGVMTEIYSEEGNQGLKRVCMTIIVEE